MSQRYQLLNLQKMLHFQLYKYDATFEHVFPS